MQVTETCGEEQLRAVGRAIGGAVIFNLPLLMTMEMWWLSYYIPPARLACLLLASLPLFVGVASVIGFRGKRSIADNIADVFVAYVFGFCISALTLVLFNTISGDMTAAVTLNAITLQAIPATLGALLGRSEIGSGDHEPGGYRKYSDEIVVLAVGALFLALNVAPTEEIKLIALQMNPWHTLALFLATFVVMLIFAVASNYRDGSEKKGLVKVANSYARFCGTAYLVSLVVSLFLLWVFEHTETMAPNELLGMTVALLFPAGIGAAAAKLII